MSGTCGKVRQGVNEADLMEGEEPTNSSSRRTPAIPRFGSIPTEPKVSNVIAQEILRRLGLKRRSVLAVIEGLHFD